MKSMEFLESLIERVINDGEARNDAKSISPFDSKKRMTPKTRLNFSRIAEGVSPIAYLEPAAFEKPYCEKAESRWSQIVGNEKFLAMCEINDGIEVRIRDMDSGRQIKLESVRVVHKGEVPIQQNEDSGICKLINYDRMVIISPIFLDEHDVKFALVARPAFFGPEEEKKVVDSFFAEDKSE